MNIHITICITVIPPLPPSPPTPPSLPPSPPSLSPHPPSVPSPPSLPHPPFPSLPSLQQIHCPFQPKQSPSYYLFLWSNRSANVFIVTEGYHQLTLSDFRTDLSVQKICIQNRALLPGSIRQFTVMSQRGIHVLSNWQPSFLICWPFRVGKSFCATFFGVFLKFLIVTIAGPNLIQCFT